MKAALFKHYGSPGFIEIEEIKKPVPREKEVLIRVCAASINEWDWGILNGKPLINRISTGIFNPKKQQLGADVSGIIEKIGDQVTLFKPGDEILGDICMSANAKIPEYRGGALAEYVCANEKALLAKPSCLSFEQAASLPQAGALAIQGLLKGDIQRAKNVLINGAGGGAGSFAIQIAKAFGANITAVDKSSKQNAMLSLGADHIIDFKREDFTRKDLFYDLILDVMGFHSIFDYRRVLAPNGRYVMLGGGSRYTTQVMLLGPLISKISKRKMGILFLVPDKDLEILIALIEEEKVTPVIDSVFPFCETAEAFRYYMSGTFTGKIVIKMT